MAALFQQTKPPPVISLLTDFGQKDGYVGAMQGVILSICPNATIVTLSHDIPPQDIRTAAFVLYQAFGYYPPQTVHCVVVDPGVGSQRREIAVRTSQGVLVGPDNGVFSLVLNAPGINVMEAVILSNLDYQLPHASATFHGRDIFAPAAAHIAAGVPLEEFGPRAINLVRLNLGPGRAAGSTGACRVIHIDRFGNLILDMTAQEIINPGEITFSAGDRFIKSLSRTFADVAEGELVAYIGSSYDHVEIAVRNGSAAQLLGLRVGDEISMTDLPNQS